MTAVSPQDPWTQVAQMVAALRAADRTRPELADATGLGRNVVSQRIQDAQSLGLIEPAGTGRSRGGRAAEVWRFRPTAGHVLVGLIENRRLTVALVDLGGVVVERSYLEHDFHEAVEATCERIADEMRALQQRHPEAHAWAVAFAMPAPVDVRTGRNVDPVTPTSAAQRWPRDFNVREWFSQHLGLPTWSDALSNLMALGSARTSRADDLVYVRVGLGLGAGIISEGRLHRGANWVAGELNHVPVSDDPERICLCGRIGCLDTYSSDMAMINDATRARAEGRSPWLAGITRDLRLDDIEAGVGRGDAACVEIVVRAAEQLGRALAAMVTWYNPAQVTIGGVGIVQNPLFRSVVERAIRSHALAATVEHLTIAAGDPQQTEGLVGASALVADALFSPGFLAEWAPTGSPANAPGLLSRLEQI